jgi:DNA polymerase I-like protein with 3'-5' exonuclease and polymerase domains
VEIKSGKHKGEKKRVMREAHELDKIMHKMGLKKDDGYHLLPREYLVPYAMKDTEYTLRLYEQGRPKLEGGLLDCYAMEQQLCLDLLDMEDPGIALDIPYLTKTKSEYGVKKLTEWQATLDLAELPDLNLNSPKQLLETFEKRGVPLENTQKETLAKVKDPLAQQILKYRGVEGLYDKLRELSEEQRDGIAHPHIRQHGAKTGRSSSSAARPDG